MARLSLFHIFLSCAVCLSPSLALAEVPSFRVNTDNYDEVTKPPVYRTVTIFSDGVYYDFEESEAGLVTIVDPQSRIIVMIDPVRRLRCEIRFDWLETIITRLQNEVKPEILQSLNPIGPAIKSPNPPEITIKSKYRDYQVTLVKPRDPDMARQYAEFADWVVRLNSIEPPGPGMLPSPPGLRLNLNHEIAKEESLPNKVVRITRSHTGLATETKTTFLSAAWQLNQDDLARVARAQAERKDTRMISFDEYRNRFGRQF